MFINSNLRVKHRIISFAKRKINFSFQSMMILNKILTFFKTLYHKFFMSLIISSISACWKIWKIALTQPITNFKKTNNRWFKNSILKSKTNYNLSLAFNHAHYAINNSIHHLTNLINYFAIVNFPHAKNV
jgi:hypothetical protein